MPLSLDSVFLRPDLRTGMRLESFQLVGKTPLDSDWLKNQVSGAEMSSASSFKSLAVNNLALGS